MLKIIPFENKYLEEMAQLYAEYFSEDDAVWSLEMAQKRIMQSVNKAPKYCLVAIDENNNCFGGIFCETYVNYSGDSLYVDAIQVKKEYQKLGVGKALFKEAVSLAQKDGIDSVFLYVDSKNEFPASWYEKIGMEKTSYIPFAAKIEELKF